MGFGACKQLPPPAEPSERDLGLHPFTAAGKATRCWQSHSLLAKPLAAGKATRCWQSQKQALNCCEGVSKFHAEAPLKNTLNLADLCVLIEAPASVPVRYGN